MKDEMILASLEEIKVFSNPYRIKIMNTIKSMGRPATVKEIADSMGDLPAKVHYHVKMLEKVNIVQLVHTKEINGIIAKYYEPTANKYVIKNEEVGSTISKAVDEQRIKLIGEIFDMSKKNFLEEVSKGIEEKISSDSGSITSTDIYLTNDEYLEFRNMIEDFFDKHSRNKGDPYNKYSVLLSMIKINQNK